MQNSEYSQVNRRQFITTAAGAIAAPYFVRSLCAADDDAAKLKLGLIGCGWYGMVDLKAAFQVGGVQCIALCDVDSDHLEKSAAAVEEMQGFRPKTFKDYRELLDVAELQAVIIATPPHWHALPFLAALEKGFDIYCEKPLAYDIREGQIMLEAANRSGKIIQVGFQRRQCQAVREAREFIQAGNIGQVVQVDVQINYTANLLDPTPQDPPPSLDWEWWCGPAPKLPYSPQIGHISWRLEKAYGHGHFVDWGIHWIDATRWILDETMPKSVQASGGIYQLKNRITTPDILTAQFDFDTCPVIWRHRLWGAKEFTPEVSNGILFFGEKGTVFVSDRGWTVINNEREAERQIHDSRNDAGVEHMADFLQAVKSRTQPNCSVQEAFYSTSTVQLGMIAYEVEDKIRWDLASKQIVANEQAAGLLKRDYRGEWKHPYSES
jgi:predicted dehydrogenase